MTDWYVRNARELDWLENAMGLYCDLLPGVEGELAINLNVLAEGQPMALYHHEPHQEGFLVLRGECELTVEGETRTLRAWDYFHCPRDVPHVLVGAGDEPALVVAVGSRVGDGEATYPNDPDPRAAYAAYGKAEKVESPL
jgi:quercetin dioxygenase-like cupin family protein